MKVPQDWRAIHALNLLGAALLGQKKHAEAEPLLVRANQGLKQRETNLPAPWRVGLLNQAAERIVQLYDDSGESHKAAE